MGLTVMEIPLPQHSRVDKEELPFAARINVSKVAVDHEQGDS
jgi:hypothetical protein